MKTYTLSFVDCTGTLVPFAPQVVGSPSVGLGAVAWGRMPV